MCRPNMAKYGEVPVLLWMDDLTDACMSAKYASHRVWSSWMLTRIAANKDWLTLSEALDCGAYLLVFMCVIPYSCSIFSNSLEINCLPLSVWIVSGTPKLFLLAGIGLQLSMWPSASLLATQTWLSDPTR